jgi:hypothetical protein
MDGLVLIYSAMMAAHAPRGMESPRGDDESQESESEINTNPSIIQGPIGGVAQADNWGYDSRSPPGDHYYDTPILGFHRRREDSPFHAGHGQPS